LVEADPGIEHGQRQNHAVDQGPGDQVLRRVGHQPSEEVHLELAVRFPNRAFELHALAVDLKEHLAFLPMDRQAQLVFERFHSAQYLIDSVVRGTPAQAPVRHGGPKNHGFSARPGALTHRRTMAQAIQAVNTQIRANMPLKNIEREPT
jgi:hypothetical protein